MKSQSFLREMANYVFKQFSGSLDAASLDHLLEIISKPVATEGTNLLEEDSDESEGEGDEESEVEIEDVASDSDQAD